jgi:hypothetical protein
MSKSSDAIDNYRREGKTIPECVNIGCDREAAIRDVKASGSISFHNMCGRCKRQHERGEPLDDGITNIRETVCGNSDGHLGWDCPVAYEEHDSYQFILDHIDGDHTNNDPENLHTLCRFCDAEKSKQAGDWGN